MRLAEQPRPGEMQARKLATLIARMWVRTESIDDVDVPHGDGMGRVFDRVYAPSKIGTLLREFGFGPDRQSTGIQC
ncbi:hypothetical protein [Nocardia sp. NPDC004123]